MHVPIHLPELGASPVVLSVWYADVGEPVYEGDRLVEVLTGGATFDVPAPATGTLAEKAALPDDTLQTGQVLGVIEAGEEDGERDTDEHGEDGSARR